MEEHEKEEKEEWDAIIAVLKWESKFAPSRRLKRILGDAAVAIETLDDELFDAQGQLHDAVCSPELVETRIRNRRLEDEVQQWRDRAVTAERIAQSTSTICWDVERDRLDRAHRALRSTYPLTAEEKALGKIDTVKSVKSRTKCCLTMAVAIWDAHQSNK